MKSSPPQPPTPSPQSPPRGSAAFIATGFGLGLLGMAPGTLGAAIEGVPLAWAISHLPGPAWQALVIAVLFAIGVPLCTRAGRALGGSKDNQAIIWDEIITVPAVFLLVQLTSWKIALAGFLLHRLFDITKPPPCGQLERLPEGLGVMADDLMASIYACVSLFGLKLLCEQLGWTLLH